jgi:hypothetical protein
MDHLSSDELVDAAEGVPSGSSSSHLRTCERCRTEVVHLQTVLTSVQRVDVPEPSPLFWDHLSERVRGAVAAGPPPRRWAVFEHLGLDGLAGWNAGRTLTTVMASALAVLVVTGWFVLFETADRGGTARSATSLPTATGAGAEPVAPADDPSLDLVAGLFDELDWDAVNAAGFSAEMGAADSAVDRLTANERRELDRLLREAIGQSGESGVPAPAGHAG